MFGDYLKRQRGALAVLPAGKNSCMYAEGVVSAKSTIPATSVPDWCAVFSSGRCLAAITSPGCFSGVLVARASFCSWLICCVGVRVYKHARACEWEGSYVCVCTCVCLCVPGLLLQNASRALAKALKIERSSRAAQGTFLCRLTHRPQALSF